MSTLIRFSFQLGKCINRKTEIDHGFLSRWWIGGKRRKVRKVSFTLKWTSRWCDVYFERFSSFCRLMFLYWAWFSYLWKDWENSFHYWRIYNQNYRTLNWIHTDEVPEHSNSMWTVCCVTWLWLWKGCGLIFHCLALSRRSEVLALTHKVFHNATAALHMGKLTSRNIAWLFFLLQPINNTELLLSLPCEHCWQLQLVWGLKKMLKV